MSTKKGKRYPHLRRARVGKCVICGYKFFAVNDISGKHGSSNIRRQKYCSKQCWNKRHPKDKKICAECGKPFETYERVKKFCCEKCRNKNYEKRTGDKSTQWKGGTNRRWAYTLSRRYLKLECELCGAREKLHAHHINQNPKDNRLENLKILCFACHSKIHKQIKICRNTEN